jgi:hypothetical protein
MKTTEKQMTQLGNSNCVSPEIKPAIYGYTNFASDRIFHLVYWIPGLRPSPAVPNRQIVGVANSISQPSVEISFLRITGISKELGNL